MQIEGVFLEPDDRGMRPREPLDEPHVKHDLNDAMIAAVLLLVILI